MRVLIATLVVLCMGLMAALLIGIGWLATSQRLVIDAAHRAELDTLLLQERVRLQLQPAQVALRQLRFDALPTLGTEAERLARRHVLLEELRANPVVSAAYVGYANGDFLLARPLRSAADRQRYAVPAEAAFLLQTVSLQPDGQRLGRYHVVDARGEVMSARDEPNYRFDPRTRPWWAAALARGEQTHLSAPYRFFTTQQLGVTLSRPAADGQAVLGIDLALDDLERLLVAGRATPGTRLALVQGDGKVLAATSDLRAVGRDALPDLSAAQEPLLLRLREQAPPPGKATDLTVDGRDWLGLRLRFDVGLGGDIELLKMVPMDELAAEARQRAQRVIAIACGVGLVLLPLGWLAGGSIGRSLKRLRERALRISRFDFGGQALKPSFVREVSELSQAMQHMGGTIEAFLVLSERMATEPEVERMLQQVLEQLTQATQSMAAAVYLWDAGSERMQQAALAGTLAFPMADSFAYPRERSARGDLRPHGPTLRHLDLELRGRDGRLQGLLVLEFEGDSAHEDAAFLQFASRLSGMLAVAIETRQLIDAQRRLFDALIQLMADAIDAKSPYTGGHCERVPLLATELLDRLHAEREGPYADYRLSDTDRYAFRLGAWLHDCGKVTSPEHIVDKATKLEVIRNRIHEVRLRFEILWRDAELAHARGTLDAEQLAARLQQLRDDFAFVAQCNLGGEFMADEAIERLRRIGAQPWLRQFDDRLGLATEELRQLDAARPDAPPLPAPETLLADRPEHRVAWGTARPPVQRDDPRNVYGFDMRLPPHQQNQGELHNLSVRRGTLTDEDRFKINDHIVQTYVMLKGLPWPAGLERVPELAATHHEKLDGQGYPRRLAAAQLSVEDRVMALADVFEALTASDRPYKTPKTLTETLRIMAFMCKDQHLDAELFRYFLRSRLWEGFAERFMQPAQRDAVDLDAIEALLPKA